MSFECAKFAFVHSERQGARHMFGRWISHARNVVDDSRLSRHCFCMGRPKQFDERIQLTLVEGTTARVDALLVDGEYRLDFIRTAIEAEIEKRSPKPAPARATGGKKPSLSSLVKPPKKG
jgi:hypothetical protein